MPNLALSGHKRHLSSQLSADSLTLIRLKTIAKERSVSQSGQDFGANDWLVEEMFERYQADPTSVPSGGLHTFNRIHNQQHLQSKLERLQLQNLSLRQILLHKLRLLLLLSRKLQYKHNQLFEALIHLLQHLLNQLQNQFQL